MSEEQQDFFKKLDQEPVDTEREKRIYEIARSIVKGIKDKSAVKDLVTSVVKEKGADPADIPAICKLVENTLIDDGESGDDYWKRN